MKITKVIEIALGVAVLFGITGCSRKKVVYLDPFENRSYFTNYNDNTTLSLQFQADDTAYLLTPHYGLLKKVAYSYEPEAQVVRFNTLSYYDKNSEEITHSEFVADIGSDVALNEKSSVRVDMPEVLYRYDFNAEDDDDDKSTPDVVEKSTFKLRLEQIYTTPYSARFAGVAEFDGRKVSADVDYDFVSKLVMESAEETLHYQVTDQTLDDGKGTGTIVFEASAYENDEDLSDGDDSFVKKHTVHTEFTVKKDDEKGAVMELRFLDGDLKGKAMKLDFAPEVVRFREGRWL